MATAAAAAAVPTTQQALLHVSYLRTYLNAGRADVFVCGVRVLELDALWEKPAEMRYSITQNAVVAVQLNASICGAASLDTTGVEGIAFFAIQLATHRLMFAYGFASSPLPTACLPLAAFYVCALICWDSLFGLLMCTLTWLYI